MFLNCGVGEDPWESLRQQVDQTSQSQRNQSWIFIGRTDAEAEAPIFWPPDVKSWLTRKDPDAGKDWSQEEKGMTKDEMFAWHHQLDGHEVEQAPGDGEGQGSLACFSPWGHKELDTLSNWTTWEWEKIIANKATDKGYIPKYISSSYSSISEKQTTQSKNWTEDLKRHFSKENIQMVNKCMKRCTTLFTIQFSPSVVSNSLQPHGL